MNINEFRTIYNAALMEKSAAPRIKKLRYTFRGNGNGRVVTTKKHKQVVPPAVSRARAQAATPPATAKPAEGGFFTNKILNNPVVSFLKRPAAMAASYGGMMALNPYTWQQWFSSAPTEPFPTLPNTLAEVEYPGVPLHQADQTRVMVQQPVSDQQSLATAPIQLPAKVVSNDSTVVSGRPTTTVNGKATPVSTSLDKPIAAVGKNGQQGTSRLVPSVPGNMDGVIRQQGGNSFADPKNIVSGNMADRGLVGNLNLNLFDEADPLQAKKNVGLIDSIPSRNELAVGPGNLDSSRAAIANGFGDDLYDYPYGFITGGTMGSHLFANNAEPIV